MKFDGLRAPSERHPAGLPYVPSRDFDKPADQTETASRHGNRRIGHSGRRLGHSLRRPNGRPQGRNGCATKCHLEVGRRSKLHGPRLLARWTGTRGIGPSLARPDQQVRRRLAVGQHGLDRSRSTELDPERADIRTPRPPLLSHASGAASPEPRTAAESHWRSCWLWLDHEGSCIVSPRLRDLIKKDLELPTNALKSSSGSRRRGVLSEGRVSDILGEPLMMLGAPPPVL